MTLAIRKGGFEDRVDQATWAKETGLAVRFFRLPRDNLGVILARKCVFHCSTGYSKYITSEKNQFISESTKILFRSGFNLETKN